MHRLRQTIWAERALIVLFLASLAGTLNLIVTVHRKAVVEREPTRPDAPAVEAVASASPLKTTPISLPSPTQSTPPLLTSQPKALAPETLPRPSPEDPTKQALAVLASATARELAEADQAEHRASALETARLAAESESKKWRRREMLVKQQVAALDEQARKIDRQIDDLAAERDVLAQERDGLKAAVANTRQGNGSYAVLPYKGENGSWRRPIVLECSNGTVTLLPKGPTFSLLDLSSMINPRSSPVILAIARELLRVQMSDSPDGAPVVPYFVFLVRPDGIRAYYELRARLERLGIAFGYELIEQNLKVDVPDFDNVATWDGTIPLEEPLLEAPGTGGLGPAERGEGLAWPSSGSGAKANQAEQQGQPATSAEGERDGQGGGGAADEFVWPARPGSRQSGGSAATGGTGAKSGGIGRGQGRDSGPISPEVAGTEGGVAGGVPRRSGSGLGSRPGTRADLSLERWPFPYPPPGAEVTGEGDGTGAGPGAGGGAQGPLDQGGAGGLGAGRGASGMGSPAAGRTRGQGVALLPDLEPAADEAGQSGQEGSGGRHLGPDAGAAARGGVNGLADLRNLARGEVTVSSSRKAGLGSSLTGNEASAPELLPEPLSQGVGSTSSTNDADRAAGRANDPSASGGRPGSSSGSKAVTALDSLLGDRGVASNSGLSSSSTAGTSLGSMMGGSPTSSASSSPSGMSGLSLGADTSTSTAKPNGTPDVPVFKSRIHDGPTKSIEVPFEIVVVCESDGLVIHPGGYTITGALLESQRKDSILVRELLAVANQRAAADPTIRPQPRVKFLVESGGSPMFWAARKQILFSGLGWPMSLQVTGTQDPHVLGQVGW
jgi:hypothetical protein